MWLKHLLGPLKTNTGYKNSFVCWYSLTFQGLNIPSQGKGSGLGGPPNVQCSILWLIGRTMNKELNSILIAGVVAAANLSDAKMDTQLIYSPAYPDLES